MIGRTISHYLIEERLGAGGMGEVYRARDLALGRAVALKVLPPGFDPALRARLLREAESSARLQHPCIATFYEAGEADSQTFIAMEFVRGRTLRERLREGPLPAAEAIHLAACLLEALAHAHAAGILHRDIKPENVMIAGEGSVKLLDFGIARHLLAPSRRAEATAGATATALTESGMILGTPGYMSPEQLKGDPVDARSDLFAVGAVLYESISGRPAFPGATPTERLAGVLSRDVAPLSGPGIPSEVGAVLSRSLARDVSRRYPSAAAFLSDLRRLSAGEPAGALPDTLAVLDLLNLSGDPADNWLGSGIAESLAADLARAPGLRLVSREKVLKARASLGEGSGQEVDALDLGLHLGCRWVLSGSFQKLGSALRVTAWLTEVATGRVVAAEKIDGAVDGIFEMQDRLAAAAARHLNVELPTPAPSAPEAGRLQAYEFYARGRRLSDRLEKGSFDQAQELYEKAIELDPPHALAFAALAGVHALRFTFTTDPRELEMAAGYAQRAIEIDPKLGEPHVWLAYALLRQERPLEAFRETEQVMMLDPSDMRGPYFAGAALFVAGRREEAVPLLQRAVEIDPTNGFAWLALAWDHLEVNHPMEARWCLGKAVHLEQAPGTWRTAGAAGYLGECLRRGGELHEARIQCLAGLEAIERSDHMYRDTFRGVCLCSLGRTALQQGDLAAARAAFGQAVSHLRGRPRALGGGHLMVQALAGLASAGEGAARFEEALRLFDQRERFNFSFFYACTDDITLLELARAARAVGRTAEARALLARALEAGSCEARHEVMP